MFISATLLNFSNVSSTLIIFDIASSSCLMVEQSTHNLKILCSNPATDIRSDKNNATQFNISYSKNGIITLNKKYSMAALRNVDFCYIYNFSKVSSTLIINIITSSSCLV
jgi:hypothetical protein